MNHIYFDESDADVSEFAKICSRTTDIADYANASAVIDCVVIYDGTALRQVVGTAQERPLREEFVTCLRDGPGIVVIRNAFDDLSVIDRTTKIFRRIVANETLASSTNGDHFGNNERIWNSLQKACLADPELFIEYYSNPLMHLASAAWLGPHYQITAQVNNVKPGGKAQLAHRDYHLGFQPAATVAEFPAHAQLMSQFLTLQGAVAHCDMPQEKGPTMLLPYSQQFGAGYVCYSRPDFVQYFHDHCVQPELKKGDLLFFSPAVFHAGGANTTKQDRMANLLQISSAFGKTMESLDHIAMIEAVYPILLELGDAMRAKPIIQTIAKGYSFPTNLDSDPPTNGNAPRSQASIVEAALEGEWPLEELGVALQNHDQHQGA